MAASERRFKGIVFDLDGVLYVGAQPIEGAAEAVRKVRDLGLICRFVTNTSTMALESVHAKLQALGLPVEPTEILTAPQAVLRYLRCHSYLRCCLLMANDVRRDFDEISPAGLDDADLIVLGDIGDELSYPLLNRIFNRMMEGARLMAVHRNRYWQTEQGLRMDLGGFVAALEYCTGRQALVMGKPSPDFFGVALEDMGLSADETAIIGDDIEADIGGAQSLGMFGVLVRTGKFRAAVVEASAIHPDRIIDSVRDLPALLQGMTSASEHLGDRTNPE